MSYDTLWINCFQYLYNNAQPSSINGTYTVWTSLLNYPALLVMTESAIPSIATMWINGMSYKQILKCATENNVMIIRRKKKQKYSLANH